MQSKIRVVLIDDHPLWREGVAFAVERYSDIEVVGQGASADEAAELAQATKPDVVLLDVSIPGGGVNALKAIAANSPGTRVMMLTVSIDKTDVLEALRLGARAYVVKGVSGHELVQALHAVVNGERYLSPALGAMLLTDVDRNAAEARAPSFKELNSREAAVLSLVAQGMSNKEVGARLGLSDKTVKHYLTSVFQKLQVRSRMEAVLLMKKISSGQLRVPSQHLPGDQRHPTGLVPHKTAQGPKTLV
jgi:two-component system, NarL family, nitrate/nitrite response regulator NarL